MQKYLLTLSLLAVLITKAEAQHVGINTLPAPTAALDVASTTQGLLIPRMSSGQRSLIGFPGVPATGLLVYQTDAPVGFYFYNGSAWVSLSSATPGGPAGGDLAGTYPNPTLSVTGATGTNAVTAINASSSTINLARLPGSVTAQGNAFNGASQLVQLNGTSQLPAVSGVNLTNLDASDLTTGNVSVSRLNGGSGASSGTYWRGDGTWASVGGLPAQAGHAGKFLTTDGTNASWKSMTPAFSTRTSNIVVSVTSPSYSNLVSINLEANRTYFVHSSILANRAGAASAAMTIRLHYTGTATTEYGIIVGGPSVIPGTSFNSSGSHDLEGGGVGTTATTSVAPKYEMDCYIKTTAAGVLTVQGARSTTNTVNDFNVREGSYVFAMPLD